MLKLNQVEELVQTQAVKRALVGNIMVAKCLLSREKLVQMLREYDSARI